MNEAAVIQSGRWGPIPLIARAGFLVVAVILTGHAFFQVGPPWQSWSSFAGNIAALALPIVGFLFSENMLPRSVVNASTGAEFQYLFSTRIVE